MRFDFENKSEKNKFELLFQTHKNNLEYLSYICLIEKDEKVSKSVRIFSFNNEMDSFSIKKNFIDEILKSYPSNSAFILDNLLWDTHLLSTKEYDCDPYLKTFVDAIPSEKIPAFGLFKYGEQYASGETMMLKMDYGFFNKAFDCPTIILRNKHKLSITPLDIKLSKIPLQIAKGKILILGLKLGYFAYLASLKQDVNEIDVVENNLELISLFKNILLPLFPQNKNVNVICADALDYLNSTQDRQYDFIYVDLWDEAQKGIEQYLSVQKAFENFHITKRFCYLENAIITQLCLLVIDVLIDSYEHRNKPYRGLKRKINQSLKEVTLSNSYELDALLSIKGLRKLLLTK